VASASQRAIDGKGAGAFNDQESAHGKRQQVVFETFTLLGSRPVHKEAKVAVHHRNGDDHIRGDAECSNARQDAKDQPQPAKELSSNRQKGEYCRYVQGPREESHGSGEPETAEPAQHLLGAMREEDQAQNHTDDGRGGAAVGLRQFAKHIESVLFTIGRLGLLDPAEPVCKSDALC